VSTLLKIATAIWKHTPSRLVREKYFAGYCWIVRGRKVLTTVNGITLQLDLSEMIDVAVQLGRFEPEVSAAIKAHAQAGDVVLDIGANAGIHALAFAAQIYPEGKVYAFEPTNHAFARLLDNVRLNPKLDVEPIQLALSDRNLPPQAVDFRSSWRTDGVIEQRFSTVPFCRLDDWIREREISNVHILKIDVDGHEYAVIKGATETLSRFLPTVVMEVGLYHFEDPSKDPVRLLQGIGYKFWDAKSKRPYSPEALKEFLSERRMASLTLNVIASARKGFTP
jgi:FkbM family methyltransferase